MYTAQAIDRSPRPGMVEVEVHIDAHRAVNAVGSPPPISTIEEHVDYNIARYREEEAHRAVQLENFRRHHPYNQIGDIFETKAKPHIEKRPACCESEMSQFLST